MASSASASLAGDELFASIVVPVLVDGGTHQPVVLTGCAAIDRAQQRRPPRVARDGYADCSPFAYARRQRREIGTQERFHEGRRIVTIGAALRLYALTRVGA